MSAHTPGPWIVRQGLHGHPDTVDVQEFDMAICRMQEWDNPAWQAANASLISAAPELLEAAKHAVMEWRLHGQLTDSCRVLESSIAKAEGQS